MGNVKIGEEQSLGQWLLRLLREVLWASGWDGPLHSCLALSGQLCSFGEIADLSSPPFSFYSNKSNLRKVEFFWITVCGFSPSEWGKHDSRSVRQQVTLCPPARKWRVKNTGAQQLMFLILFSLGPQPMGWCQPHSGWVFPLQLKVSRNTPVDTPTVFP